MPRESIFLNLFIIHNRLASHLKLNGRSPPQHKKVVSFKVIHTWILRKNCFHFCRGPLPTHFYFWLPLRPSLRNSNGIALRWDTSFKPLSYVGQPTMMTLMLSFQYYIFLINWAQLHNLKKKSLIYSCIWRGIKGSTVKGCVKYLKVHSPKRVTRHPRVRYTWVSNQENPKGI